MTFLPWSEAGEKLLAYLRNPSWDFLFIAFDSEQDLKAILREVPVWGKIKLSAYCKKDDSYPDLDRLREDLHAAVGKNIILGLGEYLALTGRDDALRMIWAMRGCGKKLVAPIWNGYKILEKLEDGEPYQAMDSPVMRLERRYSCWSYKNFAVSEPAQCNGFRELLSLLENGHTGEASVRTSIPLQPEWGKTISTHADLYLDKHPEVKISPKELSEKQWRDLHENSERLDNSFFGPSNYIFLRNNAPDNAYLKMVMEITREQSQFRQNFIDLILDYRPGDPDFDSLCAGRRQLLGNLQPEDIQEFILKLQRIPEKERIFYLTNETLEEKREIIKYLASCPGFSPATAYPDLAAYMEDCDFSGEKPEICAILNNYFNVYKQAKLRNCLEPELLRQGMENREIVHGLPSRSDVVGKLANEKTKLYWLDAFGCEYLGFVQNFANKNLLKINARPTRVELPSITSINREFYDVWAYEKATIKDLDNIKHGRDEKDIYNKDNGKQWPLHLARELEVVRGLLEKIEGELKSGLYEKIVLASDHGATRMAVISKEEQEWEMPEKGKYGGRCCPFSSSVKFKPGSAWTSSDGKWLALTDYSRFKGAHQASVEAHGGASLEEMVVPVIEFGLQGVLPKIIQILPASIHKPPVKETAIKIVVKSDHHLIKPQLRMNGKVYPMREDLVSGQYIADVPVTDACPDNIGHVHSDNSQLEPPIRFRLVRGVGRDTTDDFF